MNAISPNDLIRSNIFMSQSDKKALQTRAKKMGVSYATLVRTLIANFVGSKSEPFAFRTAK